MRIGHTPSLLILSLLLSVAARPESPFLTQNNKSTSQTPALELNQPLTGNLKGGESDLYQLHLTAQSYARVVVMQQGVDVLLRARDGQKNQLAQIDDPFGRVGPRTIELVAEVEGDYFVEVTARKDELGGTYEIKYVESRTP